MGGSQNSEFSRFQMFPKLGPRLAEGGQEHNGVTTFCDIFFLENPPRKGSKTETKGWDFPYTLDNDKIQTNL